MKHAVGKNRHRSIFVLHTKSSAQKANSGRTPFLTVCFARNRLYIDGNLKGMYFFGYGNVISTAGKVGLSLGHVSTSPEVSIREPPRDPWDNQPLGHSSNAA